MISKFIIEELGSEEESGKDWSDLEREAAEEDKNYGNKEESFPSSNHKNKKSGHDHRDKHKSRNHNRYSFL